MRKFLLLFLLSPALSFAQVPVEIPLTGNIGIPGSAAILGGVIVQFPSDANYTLNAQQWANKTLILTSATTLTATRQIVAPLNIGQEYNIKNTTTGGQSITIGGASGTIVTIANGVSATVFCDGTNYIQSAVSGGSGTVTHTAGALAANQVVIGNGTGDVKVDTGASTDGAGNLTVNSITGGGSSNGSDTLQYSGTPATTPSTNQWQLSPAIPITTPWSYSPAAAPGTGFIKGTNTSGIVQQSFEPQVNLASDVTGVLSNANLPTGLTPTTLKIGTGSVLTGTSGTGTKLASFTGSFVTGDLVMFNAAGDFIDTGGPFSSVPSLGANQTWGGAQIFRTSLSMTQFTPATVGNNFPSPPVAFQGSYCASSGSCGSGNDSWIAQIVEGTGFNPASIFSINPSGSFSSGPHTVNIPSGSTEGGTFSGGVLTGASAICTQGTACNTVTVENIFTAAGTINFTHNLNTTNPVATCYSFSGAQPGSVTYINDPNNVAVSAAGAADIVCSFAYAPGPAPTFTFTVTGIPALYVPTLAATQTIPLTVTQSPLHGYTASTTYSLIGLPSGLTGAFSPNPITGGSGTSTLTMSLPYNQTTGNNSFSVSGAGSGITHALPVSIPIATTNNGLVEGWPSNEGSGTTLFTVSSSGDNAAATAVTWSTATGFTGSVAHYNGTTSNSLGANQTNTNFTGSTPFSVCDWFNATTVSPADQYMVSTADLSVTAAPGFIFELQTSRLRLHIINNLATNNYIDVESPAAAVTATSLNQACFTYDGSMVAANTILYANGVALTPTILKNGLTASITNPNNLMIGAGRNGGTIASAFSGALGYVRVYNRVLTPSEILTLFTLGPK